MNADYLYIARFLVIIFCFFHCYLQVVEALAKGVEQGIAIVGLGGDDELVWSRLFHSKDITTIVFRVRANQQLHQDALGYEQAQFIAWRTIVTTEVINHRADSIEGASIACERIFIVRGILLTWVVRVVPFIIDRITS